VTVNVAGLDDNLFSDTLFGHRKGAFTGADTERKGLIEKAENGTLFLDEIGDLRVESQVKLLRLLQDGQYYPLGSDIAKLSNARVIVATHRDIRSMQAGNEFRQDLYYRLKSHHINIPPLRERQSDLPYLVDHFVAQAAAELGKKRPAPPKELFYTSEELSVPGERARAAGDDVRRGQPPLIRHTFLDSVRKQIAGNLNDKPGERSAATGCRRMILFCFREDFRRSGRRKMQSLKRR